VFGRLGLLFVAACLASTPALAEPSVERGHDLVQANCSMCHAIGTAGDSPNPLSPPFRTLHERYPVENLAEALAEGILVGHPQMPQFRFAADEVADIIAYLQSIQTHAHALAPRPHHGRG
jgi:cytochrome c